MLKNILIVLIYCLFPLTLYGQHYISGRVTDAEDGGSIPAATVFIANTTVGTITDANGYYRLRIPGEGIFQLSALHVGYEFFTEEIVADNKSVTLNITLQNHVLDEVVVSKKVRSRQKDINLFWKVILGQNPSRRGLYVTNPEAVYYFYNPETQILSVTCREPLIILNYETGYQIQYILNHFTHNYNSGITDWGNQYNFTELPPDNKRQMNRREKKRQKVYDSSLVKFIKSLYSNSLHENGFLLANFIQGSDLGQPFQASLLNPDSILSPGLADNSKILDLSSGNVMLIYLERPVTDNDLAMLEHENGEAFIKNSNFFMNILYGNSFRIFPDGTYENKLTIAPVNKSGTLLGLNMRLPFDYLSEEEEFLTKENDKFFDFDNVTKHLDTQLRIFPQEKLHLHTDRDYYVPGEKILFKAYLTDAFTHNYPTQSRYIYVELINQNDSLINRVMIHPENGLFHGHIFLSEIIPEGDYTLRAYTRHLENIGDDYFFKKNIRIGNLTSTSEQQLQVEQRNSRKATVKDDYDVSFFSEGGNFVEGVLNKIAFKAINQSGYPESVSGKLINEAGAEILSTQTIHAGMGSFSLQPEPGKRYWLKCRNAEGLEKQFELPASHPHAYALTVLRQKNRISIGLRKSDLTSDIPCYLLAHCRGMLLYFDAWDVVKKSVVFLEDELPVGIIQFVLLDEQMNPLSERLVFSKNYEFARVEFKTDNETYKTRNKVKSSISLFDSDEDPLSGHLSVAITDDNDIAVDSSTTILSTLLLSSELKGYIENPAYYLQDNVESAVALDYLMMTHGWRRYNIPEVAKGNHESPQFPFQTSRQISGQMKSSNFSRPVSYSEVSALSTTGFIGFASTDEQGAFFFKDLEFSDSVSFYIQPSGKSGNNQIKFIIDQEKFPPLIHAPQKPVAKISKIGEDSNNGIEPNSFIQKAKQRAKYDENMRIVNLSEVVVSAQRIERKDESRLGYHANHSSDITVRKKDLGNRYLGSIADMLRHIPSVTIRKGEIRIRHNQEEPLIVIDGIVFYDTENFTNPLDMISVNDVESIDLFVGGSTAVFGMHGFGGVISITTLRGPDNSILKNQNYNYILYKPLGYQNPVEFYSPKYETPESKYLTVPDYRTTVFWKPDIVISDTKEATFEFYTSDFPSTYSIVIEGITTDGKIIRKVEKIKVE